MAALGPKGPFCQARKAWSMTRKMGTGREKWASRRPWDLPSASSSHVGLGLWQESEGFGVIRGTQCTARAGLLRGLEGSGRPGDVQD